ncbi:MAG: protein kinase domain-containing protein [Anaerolineales bacterium]
MLTTEKVLNNRYRLDQEIGRGGMGVVYQGWDTLLQRKVAIKILRQETLSGGSADRLLNEARVIAGLEHQNIVTLFDAGEVDGDPYLVMQLVEGVNLSTYEPQDLQEIISIAVQICSGLSHAHQHGVIHRDLKPENVFLSGNHQKDLRVKIVDFGIAHSDLVERTIQGEIAGTVSYMAPEQALGQATSPQTDLYALGVMLYEMCTGCLPFTGDHPLSIISQHINAPVKPPSQLVPEIPGGLDDLILRLLSKSPGDRPASAEQVEGTLRSYLQETGEFVSGVMTVQAGQEIRHNLPLQLTSFIGRSREITEISQLIREDSCRLLSLVGPGGIGKTRLAIEAASQLKETYPDGVIFISLAPISAPDFILPAIAEALGFSLHTDANVDPQQQLLDYLEKRHMLLLLDNYEHLVESTGVIVDLLKHAPEMKLIVTTRQRLNVQGEWIFNVPGLTFPENGSPGGEDGSSAVELFIERARLADTRFTVDEEQLPHVIQICRLVAGIPLGIELASAWVSVLPPREIALEIGKNLDFLSTSSHDLPEKHHSMRAAFDYSWQLLTEEQRHAFRKLSIFRGGFDRQAAAEVAGAGLLDLSVLVDKSFLRRNEEYRYEIHELLRQYGLEKLHEHPGEFREISQRHSDFYFDFLEHQKTYITGTDQLDAKDAIRTELENMRAAIHWGIASGDEERVHSALGILMDFYLMQGYYEGVETYKNFARFIEDRYQPGFDASKPGSSMYLTALAFQIFFLSMSGSIEGSEQIGREILPGLRKLGSHQETEFCLMSLGINCAYRGEYDDGETYLKEAIQVGEQIQDSVGITGSKIWLGWIYYEAGDHAAAHQTWQEGQALALETKNRLMLAFVQSKIALLGEETGDYENAIRAQLEARESFKHFGDQVGIGYATSRLTLSLMGIGDYREAKRFGQESYASFKEMNHRWGIPASLCRIGFAEIELGENQAAWAHFTEALHLSQVGQMETLVLYSLVGLGKLLAGEKQVEQGVEILSYVIADPCTPSLYRTLAVESLAGLETELPEHEFSIAKEIGEHSTLEGILSSLPDALVEPGVALPH